MFLIHLGLKIKNSDNDMNIILELYFLYLILDNKLNFLFIYFIEYYYFNNKLKNRNLGDWGLY